MSKKRQKKFKPSKELKRVIKYANGLGVKVSFLPPERGAGAAEYGIEDQMINLYAAHYHSNHFVIRCLLHELGHHMDWVYKGKTVSEEVDKAFGFLCKGTVNGSRKDIPKKYRKIIYQEEVDGMAYMEVIHNELGLRVPLWKIKVDQELDTYVYKVFYLEGRFISDKEVMNFKRESRKRIYAKYAK